MFDAVTHWPIHAGLVNVEATEAGSPYLPRVLHMTRLLEGIIETFVTTTLEAYGQSLQVVFEYVIETPENWGGARGQISKDKGAIQKLYAVVGSIIQYVSSLPFTMGTWGVTPTHWKGQLPKAVTVARVTERLAALQRQGSKLRYTSLPTQWPSDVADALGIGFFALDHRATPPVNTIKEVYGPPLELITGHRIPFTSKGGYREYLTCQNIMPQVNISPDSNPS